MLDMLGLGVSGRGSAFWRQDRLDTHDAGSWELWQAVSKMRTTGERILDAGLAPDVGFFGPS